MPLFRPFSSQAKAVSAAGTGLLLTLLLSCGDQKSPPGSAEASRQSSPSSALPAGNSPVAAALSGKLVQLRNGAVVAAAIQGDPEYFVFYHSASW